MPNKEPFAQFLDYLITKITSTSTFITSSSNIIIGETPDMLGLSDVSFPRAELLIDKLKYNGFMDQRIIDQSFRFSIGGHIRRSQESTTSDDMYNLIRFGNELMKTVFGLHTDKINGLTICDGFIQISGYPEIFMEYELFPKISSVVLVAEADVQLIDTYSTN